MPKLLTRSGLGLPAKIRNSSLIKVLISSVCLGSVVSLATPAAVCNATESSRVVVVVGRGAPDLERYAAAQLCSYLEKLFGIKTQPTTRISPDAGMLFLVGSPATNATVKRATASHPLPKVSDQGLFLRRTEYQKRPALILGGGSPRATLWAVYELVERWGVRYLLHGDVFPERVSEFRLPDVNDVMEPKLPIRQWRVLNEHACGPTSWGMADFRPVIDQLAKLKINRILISTWTSQPTVHYEVRGIKRRSGTMFFGRRYPITDDMIGRQLFGDAKEFWNPDLPVSASYEELQAALERLLHNMMAYAHQRGMQCVLTVHPFEFAPEFASLLKSATKVPGTGDLAIMPAGDTEPEDPVLTELASTVLRTTVNTYPEADFIQLGMPEHRAWVSLYERTWRALDAKYGLSKVQTLADVLAAAERRTAYPGGAKRALDEVKGDITALYFYDRLLGDLKVLSGTHRPDMKFIYSDVAEELFPLLARVLPRGSQSLIFVDYTPSRVVRREDVLKSLNCRDIPCTLIFTLNDDNVGVLPQLETDPLSKLTNALIRYGLAGFSTRYWFIGDQDPCVAYLAKASWDPSVTPDAIDRDLMRAVCGEECVDDMMNVFRTVEAATVTLEWHGLGLTFFVPGMIMKHWRRAAMPAELIEVRGNYQRALDAARRAQAKARPAGRRYVDYWVGRLEFGVGYLDAIEAVRRAATAEAEKKPAEALQYAETALTDVRRALESYARVAQDQSDRGGIAVLNEYVYRPLTEKVAELRK